MHGVVEVEGCAVSEWNVEGETVKCGHVRIVVSDVFFLVVKAFPLCCTCDFYFLVANWCVCTHFFWARLGASACNLEDVSHMYLLGVVLNENAQFTFFDRDMWATVFCLFEPPV
jgi:hypothetical protein